MNQEEFQVNLLESLSKLTQAISQLNSNIQNLSKELSGTAAACRSINPPKPFGQHS